MKNYKRLSSIFFLVLASCLEVIGQCNTAPNVSNYWNSCANPGTPVTLRAQTLDASCSQTITHRWYTTPSGTTYITGTVESVGTCAVYQTRIDVYETTSYWVSAIINGCETPRNKVTATINTPYTPVLKVSPSTRSDGLSFYGGVVCSNAGSATVTFEASGGYTSTNPSITSVYQWYDTPSGSNLLATGPSFTTTISYSSTMNGVKTFYLGGTMMNSLGCSFPISPRRAVSITLVENPTCSNNIDKYTPQDNSFTDLAGVLAGPASSVIKSATYYDGLGRPVQKVTRKGSPQGYDFVEPIVYDGFGREAKKYLPVVTTGQTDGSFKPVLLDGSGNYTGPALNFYNNASDKIADDANPYSEKLFEANPLNRPRKIGATGATWQPMVAASSYTDLTQYYNYVDFHAYPQSGGGSVQVKILNNVLTVYFSAGFNATPLKTGAIKLIPSNPVLYDMDLGLIAMGNYRASIKNGYLFIESTTSTPVYVTGFGMTGYGQSVTFTINLNPTDRSTKKEYKLNVASEVLKWTYNSTTKLIDAGAASAPVYFPANTLTVEKTIDEQDNVSLEYKDNEGRTVLKRVQATVNKTPVNDSNYASTYFIYDDLNNQVCVIPPEAVRLAPTLYFHAAATAATKEDFLKKWAFRYSYDARRRMTEKQVPGVEPVYMVYDSRDRLVLTQDGNQRAGATNAIKYWTFTKYDDLNRPIAIGVKDTTTTVQLTQAQMQGVVNTYYSLMATTKPWRKYGERFVGEALANNVHGYTNYAYPQVTTGSSAGADRYITITYYDNYVFRSFWPAGYNYATDGLTATVGTASYTQPANGAENNQLKGQKTGAKIKVFDGGVTGGGTWLKSITYYDNKYKVIQVIADNFKGGYDRQSNLYDFTGTVLKTQNTHSEYDIMWTQTSGGTATATRFDKTAATGAWNAGAVSAKILPAGQNGWAEVVVPNDNTRWMFGLSDQNTDANYTSLDYAVDIRTDKSLAIYESGSLKKTITNAYKIGSVIRIERTGTTVKYYCDGQDISPTSSPASTSILMVDISIYSGAYISNVRSSFSSSTHTVKRTMEYDGSGRLLRLWHKLDNGSDFLLTHNTYNELGQLVDRKLHSTTASASDAHQSIDYRYNIRGWISSMNNAGLSNDGTSNDDATDYFGMNLSYNLVDTDLSNSPRYDGNVSAMKWSNFTGEGTPIQKSYNYAYDNLNRISGSVFKEKNPTWATKANNGFAETGYTYDLNGNLKTLQRNDDRAAGWMDNLVYDYGAGASQGNMLLSVQDSGDDFVGFVDGNATATQDFTFDANGNLTRDLNKGIGTSITDNSNLITYNLLNLPETVTKGGNTIRYFYDATGRKLSQVVISGNIRKQTDYATDFTYENDNLQFVEHEEGRIVMSSRDLISVDHGESVATMTATGALLAPVTMNGTETYIRITANGTTSRSGVFPIGTSIPVVGGQQYLLRVKGFRTGTKDAFLLIKANTTDLNWPGTKLPNGLAAESWLEQIITIPAAATTLQVGLVWDVTVNGENIYLNEFEIHRLDTSSPEYEYHLKDHLGNIRLTFTTQPEIEGSSATLEKSKTNIEQSQYLRYENAKRVSHYLFDITNGSAPTIVEGTAQRLNGSTNEVVGLARSLDVMPGDVINMEVYAKYVDANPRNRTTALNNFITQIAASTVTGGAVIDGSAYRQSSSSFPFPVGMNGTASSTGKGPKAFLNWLVFDKNFKVITEKSGYARLSETPREYGQDVAHEKLSGSVTISQPGYVYIYFSNEELKNPSEVYFDAFSVTVVKSPITQTNDYYPYGLTFNSGVRGNALPNMDLFNGKELQDELDVNWLDYGERMYQPEIGRWTRVDPAADKYVRYTPYAYTLDNPVNFIDPDGAEVYDFWWGTVYTMADAQMQFAMLQTMYAPKPDPLSFESLSNNPNYQGYTVNDLRNDIKQQAPDLPDWKVNISAGIVFEQAYFRFVAYTPLSETFNVIWAWGYRKIKPDHIHGTEVIDPKGKKYTFPYGGYIEVKATQTEVNLKTSDNQILAYLNKLPYATDAIRIRQRAGDHKAASLTLVLAHGTKVDPALIREASRRGVNVYVSYAFQNINTGGIVFSTPKRLNNISREQGTSPNTVGSMEGVKLQAEEAINRWKRTNGE